MEPPDLFNNLWPTQRGCSVPLVFFKMLGFCQPTEIGRIIVLFIEIEMVAVRASVFLIHAVAQVVLIR